MKSGTKYRLKEDRLDWPAGTIVYPLLLCDYGVKSDDTRFTGIEYVSVTQDPEGGYPFITTPIENLEEIVEAPTATSLLPGPYRFEAGDTADTYRIYAAGDDKPMVEMIYVGGEEDFAAAALGLARLFASGPKLLAALRLTAERLGQLIEMKEGAAEDLEAYEVACLVIVESTGKEAA